MKKSFILLSTLFTATGAFAGGNHSHEGEAHDHSSLAQKLVDLSTDDVPTIVIPNDEIESFCQSIVDKTVKEKTGVIANRVRGACLSSLNLHSMKEVYHVENGNKVHKEFAFDIKVPEVNNLCNNIAINADNLKVDEKILPDVFSACMIDMFKRKIVYITDLQ